MYTKLEWLVRRILLFTLRAHATLQRKHALPTSVGLTQAHPNKNDILRTHVIKMISYGLM